MQSGFQEDLAKGTKEPAKYPLSIAADDWLDRMVFARTPQKNIILVNLVQSLLIDPIVMTAGCLQHWSLLCCVWGGRNDSSIIWPYACTWIGVNIAEHNICSCKKSQRKPSHRKLLFEMYRTLKEKREINAVLWDQSLILYLLTPVDLDRSTESTRHKASHTSNFTWQGQQYFTEWG